jgi:hypothetical protein
MADKVFDGALLQRLFWAQAPGTLIALLTDGRPERLTVAPTVRRRAQNEITDPQPE